MTDKKNTGPQEGVKGVVEDVKGKAKEAVGTVTGRDDMVREGKAQQDKADAQQDAAKKEAQAESDQTWSGCVPATPAIRRCCATRTDRHV